MIVLLQRLFSVQFICWECIYHLLYSGVNAVPKMYTFKKNLGDNFIKIIYNPTNTKKGLNSAIPQQMVGFSSVTFSIFWFECALVSC